MPLKQDKEIIRKFVRMGLPTESLIRVLCAYGIRRTKVAALANVSESTVYNYELAMRLGYRSHMEFEASLVKRKYGNLSLSNYRRLIYQKNTNGKRDFSMMRIHRAEREGFSSLEEYDAFIQAKRQRRKYIKTLFRNLVRKGLIHRDMTQREAAERLGIDESAVSWYFTRSFPRKGRQEKLFEVAGLPYRTLNDIVEDKDLDERAMVWVNKGFIASMVKVRRLVLRSYESVHEGYRCNLMDEAYGVCNTPVNKDERLEHFVKNHLRTYLFS